MKTYDAETELEAATREYIALEANRDAWRKAARLLYVAMQEGNECGRPMDLVSKADWHAIVFQLGEAEGGK